MTPEPPRRGEEGDCPACADDPALGRITVWSGDRWRVHALRDFPLAGTCLLEPRRHADGLVDLDERELADLGRSAHGQPRRRPGGGHDLRGWLAHLHVWTSRGRSALDLRGSALFAKLDDLPQPSAEEVTAAVEDLGRRLHDVD